MPEDRILVSACLLGWRCRYDGKSKPDRNLIKTVEKGGGVLVPVCPETLGGLEIPREPAVIIGGDGAKVLEGKAKVIDRRGRDVTGAFIKGAYGALSIAGSTACCSALLKEGSPSCGMCRIKDAEGRERKGMGVAAALLSSRNILIKNHL